MRMGAQRWECRDTQHRQGEHHSQRMLCNQRATNSKGSTAPGAEGAASTHIQAQGNCIARRVKRTCSIWSSPAARLTVRSQ